MSDYTFNMGPLRSAIHILQLHTHNATRLRTGRRATENGRAPIIVMPRFIEILNQMCIAAECMILTPTCGSCASKGNWAVA